MGNAQDIANANAEGDKAVADATQAEIDAKVDNLSKPENAEELDKVLNNEFKAATQEGDPADKTPDKSPEELAAEEAKAKADGDKTPDEIKAEEKANTVKDLLSDRNKAKDDAAQAEIDAQTDKKRITDLEAENERLKSGDKGTSKEDVTDDTPLTKAEVQKMLDEDKSNQNKKVDAEKANIAAVDALKDNKKTPNSEEYRKDILEGMEKHPTMSAYAIYKMLQGADVIPTDDASVNANADKLNTGDKTKANLLKNKKPSDMSDEELDKAVLEGYNTGNIRI